MANIKAEIKVEVKKDALEETVAEIRVQRPRITENHVRRIVSSCLTKYAKNMRYAASEKSQPYVNVWRTYRRHAGMWW